MSKVKSAICLTLMTLLIAVLCVVCFATFGLTNGTDTYNSVLSMTEKDADLGMPYGGKDDESGKYMGGGYSRIYYPEGVISAEEYHFSLLGLDKEEDKQEYEERYAQVGALYFDTDEVKLTNGAPNEDFCEQFENAVQLITGRYEALHAEDVRVSVQDGYTVRVFVPTANASSLEPFSYTGDFTVKYGTSADSAATIMPARASESIKDYVKGAHAQRGADGSHFVVIDFTDKGREALKTATAGAAESSATVYFRVGDNSALELSVSEQIDQSSLGITNANFTSANASTSAILIDTAVNGEQTEIVFTLGSPVIHRALYGEDALMWLYIAYGVCALAMLVFFFVRYHLLAFAHLYTYLLFLCASVLCLWAIPFLTLSVETFVAFMVTSAMLCISDAATFEAAGKEYKLGKTMTSSVKTGYKKTMWHIFDLHIVVALFGFFAFFAAIPPVSSFAFFAALTAVFSGVCALLINRFNWAILMAYTENKGTFCNFKRAEADNE